MVKITQNYRDLSSFKIFHLHVHKGHIGSPEHCNIEKKGKHLNIAKIVRYCCSNITSILTKTTTQEVKDDFQSLLRSLRTLMFIKIINGSLDGNICEAMLFVKNHIPYLWDLSNSFSNSFIDFYSCDGFHQVIYQKEWASHR